MDGFKYAQRCGNIAQPQIFGERPRRNRRQLLLPLHDRAQFGGEGKLAVRMAVIKWLDADAVAGEGECLCVLVPHRDGEHPVHPRERLRNAPGIETGDHHLGIAMPAKRHA